MNLRYSKKFAVALKKLSASDKAAALHALEWFEENPFAPQLRNHALTDSMAGKRALVVEHDLRIIFTERGNHRDVTLLDIGSHARVYRR